MRIDKNLLYILAFLAIIVLINTSVVNPMKDENKRISLQIETIREDKNRANLDGIDRRRKIRPGSTLVRDLDLYELSNSGLDIESMEVNDNDEYREYQLSLTGNEDSLLKFIKGLRSVKNKVVVDSLSYDGQNVPKYSIKLHFFD
nr:hypothetical protein [uncultured Peptostreptococcus sp.]